MLPMPELDPQLQPFILGLAFIVGLCFGSFLNVVAHRFLTDQSVINPPSHCVACKTPIGKADNIPLVSYLLLGGKCRQCKASIGLEYPLAELATGLLFVAVVWYAGLTLQTLFLLFLACNLVVIFLTDLKESLIFQINSLSLIPVGLVYNFFDIGGRAEHYQDFVVFQLPDVFISAVIAVLAAFLVFEGLILFSEMAFGTEGFGHGDTHLMMGVGAFVGWQLMLIALLLGFIFQSIPAIPVLVYQWIKNKDYISLGSGAAGVFFGLAPVWLVNVPLEPGLRSILILASFAITIGALVVFLRRMKHNQTFTYLPLGPALILGSLTVLFFGPEITDFLFQNWR